MKRMAGMGGIEPPTYDTKNRCSTAELHPNNNSLAFYNNNYNYSQYNICLYLRVYLY
jgi:hypothetical protein